MKIANLATIAAFALFLAAPVGCLAVLGLDPAAEKVVTLDELASSKLVAPDDQYRDDVARRLVTNSSVGMNAIRAKNSLDFNVFGFVNTSDVISGEDGWLFYKPGFQNGTCLADADVGKMLGHVEALRVIASGIGIDLRVSVSPDKEVVYPEHLGRAAFAAAGCKIRSSRAWRTLAKASGSSIIDHFEVMRHDVSDVLLYFKTDTHWNDLGKLRGLGHLAEALTGRPMAHPISSNGPAPHKTDIPNVLLRISHEEPRETYGEFIERSFPDASKEKIADTLIVHDSFYGVSRDLMSRIFHEPTTLSFGEADFAPKLAAAIAKRPRRMVVNSVERALIQRMNWGDLAWTGTLGRVLLDTNAGSSRDCSLLPASADAVRLVNVAEEAGAFKAGVDPQIYVRLPEGGRPCLHLSFQTSKSQPTLVYLPIENAVNQNGPYFNGFALDYPGVKGLREVRLVLPESFSGKILRIDPIHATDTLASMEIKTGTAPK